MAKERKASVIYEGNGTQQTFSFPFDYLRKAFVKAEIIEVSGITELEQGKDYSITDKELTLASGVSVATGNLLKIYRETTTDPLVEWQDASVLRSADLSLQEVQLLHLSEETADKVFDSGMATDPTNSSVWDGQYKRITNLLDPQEDGDAVTLRYIEAEEGNLIGKLKSTGAEQVTSVKATGDNQNTRLTTTGDTQNTRLTTTGDTQNKRLTYTGDAQNSRLTNTGDSYVNTMTTLKADATTQAEEAKDSAELAKKWTMSDTSPDGVTDNKSSKTWANEAKNSASSASSSASTATTKANEAKTSATSASASASTATTKATEASNSATSAASSASTATTKANEAKTSATSASNSAIAAAKSAQLVGTFDPTNYPLKQYTLDLSALDENTFYPVIFNESNMCIEAEIHSMPYSNSFPWNQNVLSFRVFASGWHDGAKPPMLTIKNYNVHDTKEITIGCIAVGGSDGGCCVWLRGGRPSPYTIISTVEPELFATGWSGHEGQVVTIGPTYHGAETGNINMNILFSPLDIPAGSAKNFYYTTYGTFETAIKDSGGNVIKDTYATKAEITQLFSTLMHAQYPVGSYIYSDKANNPATYLPYMSDTTWVQTAAGRVLIGAGTADSGTTYTAGATGGEEKHKLTESELPAHAHDRGTMNITGTVCSAYGETKTTTSGAFTYQNTGGRQDGGDGHDGEPLLTSTISFDASKNWTGQTSTVGDSATHNNMQPYSVVYIFKRTT